MSLQIVKLGEVAEFIRGITFKPKDLVENLGKNIVGVMRTKNVQENLDLSDILKIDKKFVKRKNQYLEEGDLLVSSANSLNLVGKTSWVPALEYPCSFGGFVTVLRGNKNKIHQRYLYYWFVSEKVQMLLRSFSNKTTNISNLNLRRACELKIPLPPLAEQQRILETLDRTHTILRKRQQAMIKLDVLAQNIFTEMFGATNKNSKKFPTKKLGEIIKFEGGSQPPATTFSNVESDDKIRLVQIRDFRTDKHKTYIPKNLAKRFFETGDVMIGRYGPPVFQIFRGLSGSYNVALMKAKPKEKVTKDFIYYLLKEHNLHSYVVANSERTAGQSGVNLDLLENYKAYLPPWKLQIKFSDAISIYKKLKDKLQDSNLKIKEMFAALQHQLFS